MYVSINKKPYTGTGVQGSICGILTALLFSDYLRNCIYLKNTPVVQVKYGLLYNYYAVTDSRNIAAAGWHVPTYAEAQAFITYLGGESVGGGKLKETGTEYWEEPNVGATNEYGFDLRGAGWRIWDSGVFAYLKSVSMFWVGDYSEVYKYYRFIVYGYSASCLTASINAPKEGSSVRLVKDSTTLSHGQSGLYIGNDGKVYRTICIGTKEWLADNLCETKYRNGDTIPEITDNSAWIALTTGALCAYDNDWNNV